MSRASRRRSSSVGSSSSRAYPWLWRNGGAPEEPSTAQDARWAHLCCRPPEIFPLTTRYLPDPRGGRRVTDEIRSRMVELLPRLRRFAYALTGDLDQGDDLVQEACARALSRVDQFEAGTRFDSWMFRIAQNIWFDRKRAQKVRGPVADLD